MEHVYYYLGEVMMRFVKSLDDIAFGRGLVGHCDAITSIVKGTL
jgi:hypothetical protein